MASLLSDEDCNRIAQESRRIFTEAYEEATKIGQEWNRVSQERILAKLCEQQADMEMLSKMKPCLLRWVFGCGR